MQTILIEDRVGKNE